MASVEKGLGRPDYPSCFFFRELPYKIDVGSVAPDVAERDNRVLEEMTRPFSLRGGVIDPETLGEQLQDRRNKPSHPFAKGLHQVGDWLKGLQRRFPSTET